MEQGCQCENTIWVWEFLFPSGCGEHANDACIVVVPTTQIEHTNYETMKE